MIVADLGYSGFFYTFVLLLLKTSILFCLSNLSALSVPDECYSRNASCALNQISRPHIARTTMDFLILNNINVLPWPSKSPDLNPIEHLLDEPDRCVRQRQPHLNNWTNSVKHCNMNGKGYHRSEYIMYSLHAKEMQNSVSRKWWSQYILILTSPEIDPIYSI